jgi:DnaJ-class molecular chaperone
MTYDHWKQTNPEDALDDEPPEVWIDCPACGGEGSYEIAENVSKWSIDPPGSYTVICETCNGVGGFIEEAEGN